MKRIGVVTSFLEREGKILLLKRSKDVSTYKGKWAGVSGYLEKGNLPYQQALIEIGEETGLAESDLECVKTSEPMNVVDEKLKTIWIIHIFHFRVKDPSKIRLDWEHKEAKWILPSELKNYKTVPGFAQAWEKVK
jgi:ADP-ribose pyrophosphatase YjhB (NUDIX family)